jgi:hypothetical protein
VSGSSTLTKSAQIILTAAVGLAGTSVQAYEPIRFIPAENPKPVISIAHGLFEIATDQWEPSLDIIVPAIDFSRSDSRWYRYVSKRLRELGAGEYDFTGFQIPTTEVVELARGVANNLFRPQTPTPSIVPSEDGDILYIWHKAGWDLEIDVGLGGTTVWAHDRSAGREWYGSLEELRVGVANLLDFLAWR